MRDGTHSKLNYECSYYFSTYSSLNKSFAEATGFEPVNRCFSTDWRFSKPLVSATHPNFLFAESVGFEPTDRFHESLVFKTSVLNHSTNSLLCVISDSNRCLDCSTFVLKPSTNWYNHTTKYFKPVKASVVIILQNNQNYLPTIRNTWDRWINRAVYWVTL